MRPDDAPTPVRDSSFVCEFFGDVAVVTGREATTGEGVAFQGRFTHVWVEESGVWRLVAVQRTDIAAAK